MLNTGKIDLGKFEIFAGPIVLAEDLASQKELTVELTFTHEGIVHIFNVFKGWELSSTHEEFISAIEAYNLV